MMVQMFVFVVIYIIYMFRYDLGVNRAILLFPISLLLCAGFAFGAGLLISLATAKYKDLDTVLQFILRLFMFAAPVVYSSTIIPSLWNWRFWLTPFHHAIPTLRFR